MGVLAPLRAGVGRRWVVGGRAGDAAVSLRLLSPSPLWHRICRADGRPMRHEYLSRSVGKLMDTMGWPEVTFHSHRRTHGSLLALQQANPKVVQEPLGHGDYETTHKHYTAVLQGMHQHAADSLDSLLQSAD